MASSTPRKKAPAAPQPSKKPAPSSRAHVPAAPLKVPPGSASYNPSTARAALGGLLPRWPPLDPKHRRAFQKLGDDLERSKLGARTKSLGVLQDGVAWATQMDAALRQYGAGALKSYSPVRFVYFLELLHDLADQISASRVKNKSVGAARGAAASHRDAALAAREALLSPLRTFAGDRDEEREALRQAIGTIDPGDQLGQSLADLAELARRWLALADEDSIFLAANAGLTEGLAGAAVEAAQALTGSAAEARLEGPAAGHDSPLVNLAEGAVLLEMREAMRLFGEANARHPAVKKLSPGPSTRSVLGRRGATVGAPAPPPAAP